MGFVPETKVESYAAGADAELQNDPEEMVLPNEEGNMLRTRAGLPNSIFAEVVCDILQKVTKSPSSENL